MGCGLRTTRTRTNESDALIGAYLRAARQVHREPSLTHRARKVSRTDGEERTPSSAVQNKWRRRRRWWWAASRTTTATRSTRATRMALRTEQTALIHRCSEHVDTQSAARVESLSNISLGQLRVIRCIIRLLSHRYTPLGHGSRRRQPEGVYCADRGAL